MMMIARTRCAAGEVSRRTMDRCSSHSKHGAR